MESIISWILTMPKGTNLLSAYNRYPKFPVMVISFKHGVFWQQSGDLYRESAEVCSSREYSPLASSKVLKRNLLKKTSNLRVASAETVIVEKNSKLIDTVALFRETQPSKA